MLRALHGRAGGEVPRRAGRAAAGLDGEVVAVVELVATTAAGRRPSRPRRRVREWRGCRRPARAPLHPARAVSSRDTRRAVTAGHHGDGGPTSVRGHAADQDRLVGAATVGVDVPSAQYHVADTASLGGTATLARTPALPRAATAGDDSLRPWYTPAATNAPMTTRRIGHRGGPLRAGHGGGDARRRRASARPRRASSSSARSGGSSGRGSSVAHTRSHQNVSSSTRRRAGRRAPRARADAARVPRAIRGIAARPGAAPPPEHDQPDHQHRRRASPSVATVAS